VYKFADDQGGYLAALITYYGFLSLFPLLLIFSTVLGFALPGNETLQQQLVDSALAQFPIIGDQLTDNAQPLRGSGTGLAVGILVALYGALGVAVAIQNAFNQVWGVPMNRRPDPVRARLRSMLLLLLFGRCRAQRRPWQGPKVARAAQSSPVPRFTRTARRSAAANPAGAAACRAPSIVRPTPVYEGGPVRRRSLHQARPEAALPRGPLHTLTTNREPLVATTQVA
jgi:hypothetical protein